MGNLRVVVFIAFGIFFVNRTKNRKKMGHMILTSSPDQNHEHKTHDRFDVIFVRSMDDAKGAEWTAACKLYGDRYEKEMKTKKAEKKIK